MLFTFGRASATYLLMAACFSAITLAAQANPDSAGWVLFARIEIAMLFDDGTFGDLNKFGAERFPCEVCSDGLGFGIGVTQQIIGPAQLISLFGAKVSPGAPSRF